MAEGNTVELDIREYQKARGALMAASPALPADYVNKSEDVVGAADLLGNDLEALLRELGDVKAERDVARRVAQAWRDFAVVAYEEPPSPDYLLPWERGE